MFEDLRSLVQSVAGGDRRYCIQSIRVTVRSGYLNAWTSHFKNLKEKVNSS
jgi:hypothetical protein